jgi:FkbM family methyltransferase
MSDPLLNLLRPAHLTHVVDVGANPIDGAPPYKHMLAQGLCRVTGFEPQPQALTELIRLKGPLETYLPQALGAGGDATLNVCQYSGWTSLLKPSAAALAVFPQFQTNATVIQQLPMLTHKLDEINDVLPFDLLKIDVQGAEMDVFSGAIRHLKNAVAIQTEVSFIALYEKQPTWGEVDVFLRTLGFVPHGFVDIKRWPIAPLEFHGTAQQGIHQLLEADVVYVKDFVSPTDLSDEQLKQLSMVMHHCYQSHDLSARCIKCLVDRGALQTDSLQRYVDLLNHTNHP